MTDHPEHIKERMAIEAVGAQRERERIERIVREAGRGIGRFVNREWLLRQIAKGA